MKDFESTKIQAKNFGCQKILGTKTMTQRNLGVDKFLIEEICGYNIFFWSTNNVGGWVVGGRIKQNNPNIKLSWS